MIFSRPCRDWIVLVEPTQHCVLGYTQPSLRDCFPGALKRSSPRMNAGAPTKKIIYSSASGWSPKPFSPAAFFSFHFFTQASQLAPAARSLPLKASPAISL